MTRDQSRIELTQIPGIGKSLAVDLWNIGIKKISDLKAQDPETLYDLSNKFAGTVQDRCVYTLSGVLLILPRLLNQKENLKN